MQEFCTLLHFQGATATCLLQFKKDSRRSPSQEISGYASQRKTISSKLIIKKWTRSPSYTIKKRAEEQQRAQQNLFWFWFSCSSSVYFCTLPRIMCSAELKNSTVVSLCWQHVKENNETDNQSSTNILHFYSLFALHYFTSACFGGSCFPVQCNELSQKPLKNMQLTLRQQNFNIFAE